MSHPTNDRALESLLEQYENAKAVRRGYIAFDGFFTDLAFDPGEVTDELEALDRNVEEARRVALDLTIA